MTIEHTAEWWRGADQNWDELVALLKGCSLAEQQTGAATRRRHDAKVVRRLVGATMPVPYRAARALQHAA
jgi:hypothetical protein